MDEARNRLRDVMKRATTLIIAIIVFLESVASLNAAPCSVTSPGCGGTYPVVFLPVVFSVDVSDQVDPATVDASDFSVNGIPADSFVIANDNFTIIFNFNRSPVVQGINTIHIPAGAFDCGGGSVLEFTCRIRYILTRPFPTPHPRSIAPQ